MKKELTPSQKALKLLSSVPSKDFITGKFTDNVGKCCAIGHIERLTSNNSNNYTNLNCYDGSIGLGRKIRELRPDWFAERYRSVYLNKQKNIC